MDGEGSNKGKYEGSPGFTGLFSKYRFSITKAAVDGGCKKLAKDKPILIMHLFPGVTMHFAY